MGFPSTCLKDNVSCICGTSLTERDATFAVSNENRVRIYSSSELFLLHEFSSIHDQILQMHHTSFCDAIVTLETTVNGKDGDCFLCVYHDWRSTDVNQKLVRAYTLPLAITDPHTICLSVCSFTGRVALATTNGFGVNIWQTSDGFFEHVMELKVKENINFVAVHGVYIAISSASEVRVMEISVETTEPSTNDKKFKSKPRIPERKKELFYNTMEKENIPMIRIPSLYGASTGATTPSSSKSVVHVMDKDNTQLEAFNLAGLFRDEDVRVNAALEYVRCDVKVLLQRYLPPNHAITNLEFLPETIDSRRVAQSRSYARLIVTTSSESFLYYFLADEVDRTRDIMAKKILQRTADPLRGTVEPITITNGNELTFTQSSQLPIESGRVVMHYKFSTPVSCVTANSSFLFASTLAGLEIWSLWSPCHHLAAKKALDAASPATFVPQPTRPQLLGVRPLSNLTKQLIALDGYIIARIGSSPNDGLPYLMHASASACLKSHQLPFELRKSSSMKKPDQSVVVYPQSPPSTMFQQAKNATQDGATKEQLDLLLSLFSLYRFRADVGFDAMQDEETLHAANSSKEILAIQLETKLYDSLAKSCAAHIAHLYTTPSFRNLTRAALLYVASNVSSRDVLLRFRSLDDNLTDVHHDVIDATALYLEAFLFPRKDPASYLGVQNVENEDDTSVDVSFTSVVLRHYGDHAPEQLSRLVIDSSLVWTLLDIDYCLAKLRLYVQKSVLIRIGVLVLLIRARSMTASDLKVFLEAKAAYHNHDDHINSKPDEYSYETIAAQIEWLAENYPDPLIHLCVTHPEFLVQKSPSSDAMSSMTFPAPLYRSVLASGLMDKAPTKCLTALELIFQSALGHQNSFNLASNFCLGVVGVRGSEAALRIQGNHREPSNQGPFEALEVYVLCAVHFMLLHLCKQSSDMYNISPLAIEYIQLCIRLSSSTSPNNKAMLTHALATRSSLLPKRKSPPSLPTFVVPFITAAIGSPKASHIHQTLHQVYLFACHLVTSVDAPQLEYVSSQYTASGPIATLMELLVLPRLGRVLDGLRLLHENPENHKFLTSYAIAFCETMEEWKALVEFVLDPATVDGEELLQETLSHLALTLTPDQMLDILPDTANALQFLDALERCVRKEKDGE